jgi:hypothetical protein
MVSWENMNSATLVHLNVRPLPFMDTSPSIFNVWDTPFVASKSRMMLSAYVDWKRVQLLVLRYVFNSATASLP